MMVLAPNGSAIANAAGIPKLKKRSRTISPGHDRNPSRVGETADLYQIDIRIASCSPPF